MKAPIADACIIAKKLHAKPDTASCPKCGLGLVSALIDVNLTESRCVCGYSVRDRYGSLSYAEQIAEEANARHGEIKIMRRPA